ncbi:uncharacterized protein Z520_00502 [Fonsecaea multimorphosa CBS 102226]|uniref:Het-C-domain-containing protein n=1 Tax=Fonsecaea multimorphosa CBS 102226 TaxID=1442371 RepID=A0A0D2HPQ3_9EURO|nr:uncharacterized protein Z520_00502 [Fonsecaea multimorphosa CBS 102226]KIY03811.1 hypothetical protein Z520_00502 [Fonsecaea multimorphosa CBS 102226]OAL32503.1 hypothetical protein AYO22_00525 [Fonsecaea multimorphosa]
MALFTRNVLLCLFLGLILFTLQAQAFGAGNIASISAVEGKNWRHGDIEDVLKTVACIRHHKWNSMMIKRVYFGNWLRDYSQAMDTGALKKAQPETIRILVWLLSFLGFGYATAEFEVTSERLGVYRPEEHIDNPKDYNDNEDARKYDVRLRAPVRDIELQVDMETGMKNYIANGKGDWATSAAFVKYSFERSIHHGRLYTNGNGFFKGKDEDLAEALRCLGQGLHTLEDFGAHTNYVELALREMGFHNVFPHVGTATAINLRGKHVFPLVTGTFGMVDFYHSVLGEATDHFTQSEVNEMDNALGTAQQAAQSSNPLMTLVKLLSKVPGTKGLCDEAEQLQASAQAQARSNQQEGYGVQGAYRGVESYGESSRGVDDWEGNRASHPSYSSQPQAYDANSWTQQSETGYQPRWEQNPPQYQQQSQWHDQGVSQSFNNPAPPQQQPQWHDQGVTQMYNIHDQYGGTHQGWQQPSMEPWQQQPQHPDPHASQPVQSAVPPQVPTHSSQSGAPASNALEGLPNFDPAKTIAQIYPILAFRDKVVRTISGIIEKIPGLEALVDRITETLTVFILSLLAPFVRPILNVISKALQTGSEGVLDSSAKHQYEVWTDPHSTDPTHSMLSKDHFSNLLNEPAGNVAAEILKFIAPRVLYAWEHPDVPVQQVMRDIEIIFHHPAIRDEGVEVHRNMFASVKRWVDGLPDRGHSLETVLSSDGVRAGKNHKAGVNPHIQHSSPSTSAAHQASSGPLGGLASFIPGQHHDGGGGGRQSSSNSGAFGGLANLIPGGHQSSSHGSNPLGMVGDVLGNFTGHKPAQQHHGGGGGLSNMLSMADKLPLPGSFSKYTKFMGGFPGSGARGLDEQDLGSSGSELGGSKELHEAALLGDRSSTGNRSPSPRPMQPPAGYEQYGREGVGGQGYGQEGQDYQYQTSYQDPYQSQGQYPGGGEGAGYYGGR